MKRSRTQIEQNKIEKNTDELSLLLLLRSFPDLQLARVNRGIHIDIVCTETGKNAAPTKTWLSDDQ
jgi:hypothetical protein